MSGESKPASEFDAFADDYEAALARGLAASGEGRDYFAERRIEFLRGCLAQLGHDPRRAMDFGCGTGDTVPLLRDRLGAATVVGVDDSRRSIERAARAHAAAGITFAFTEAHAPAGDLDLVYTNGVFHHIPPAARPAAFRFLRDALRPGGLLSLWENNPWSLPARYVMSRIPFDREAVMLSAREARALAAAHGFRVLRTDYRFVFPRVLRALRPLEGLIQRAPVGAQYQLLCARVS